MDYKTEFGMVCNNLLSDVRKAPGTFMMFMRVFDSQFAIAKAAIECHPKLGVDADDTATWLIFCCIPLQVAKDGGEIRFKFPHRGDSYRTIGKARFEDSTLFDFEPDERTVETLINCLESWVRFDSVAHQPISNESPIAKAEEPFHVTKKELDFLLVSPKAESLRKDKRVNWPDAVSPPSSKANRYDYVEVRSAIEQSTRPDKGNLLSRLPESVKEARAILINGSV